jgi:hypothetical protein
MVHRIFLLAGFIVLLAGCGEGEASANNTKDELIEKPYKATTIDDDGDLQFPSMRKDVLSDGSFFMQVLIELEVDGEPLGIENIVHCMPYEGFNGRYKYVNYYVSPLNKVFSHRLTNGSAILIWTPEACQAVRMKKDNETGKVTYDWPAVPEEGFPLIGWLEDANNADEILLYASFEAYKNKNARIEYKSMRFQQPDNYKLDKGVSLSDEYWWLGSVRNVFFKGRFHEEPSYSGSYILFAKEQYRSALEEKLPLPKGKESAVFIEDLNLPDESKIFGAPLADWLYRGGGFLGNVFFKPGKALEVKRDMENGRVRQNWIDAVPLQYQDNLKVARSDMKGFIYLYSQNFLSDNNVKSFPLRITNKLTMSGDKFLKYPFYAASMDEFILVRGTSYHHFNQNIQGR